MDTIEVFKVAGAILGSVGGSAIIIIGLSSWLGKVWANRILEQDKLKYSSELELIKNKLQSESEKQNLMFSLYFEGQFKLYNDLWVSLAELQNGVELLWAEANSRNLRNFISVLKKAKIQIRSSALLIEPNHYREIMEVIDKLESYQVGKETLINARRNIENVSERNIQEIIEQNRDNRKRINVFVEHMLRKMREQIGGAH
jgi:hypothetical protein